MATAYINGIFISVASGNEYYTTKIVYPSCVSGATSVGASNNNDEMLNFTNRASILDLLAPGYKICGPRANNTSFGNPTCIDSQHANSSGTSFAAPHVAGAAALLLERDPTLTPDEITQILKDTGHGIYDYPKTNLTFSRIDILAAINSLCTCTSWTEGSCGAGGCSSYERPYTRTCTPSGCKTESVCNYSSSCTPGGGSPTDVTVCASGCNYTSIDTAVRASKTNYRVYVVDNRSYNENIHMNSTTTEYLICENGSRIYGTSLGNEGITLKDVSSPVIVGCIIDGFDTGIYVYDTTDNGLIQNNTIINNGIGIYFKNDIPGMKIKYNNISSSISYGIEFYGGTYSSSAISNKIENNLVTDNGEEIYMKFGQSNLIKNNYISGGTSYGINIEGTIAESNIACSIQNNFIYGNNQGIYLSRADFSIINTNLFCPSNTNVDIDVYDSASVDGTNNTCEKPGTWNDNGVTGCTYYCDTPASATLLFPPNNYEDADGDVDLVCEANDNSQLANVSLYHNLSGTWQMNQTRNISGTSNVTTFNINNLLNGTNFIWNCLAYDNKSRGGFASANWSMSIIIPPDYFPNVTLISPANNSTDEDGTVIFNCSATDDNNLVNITLYGNWSGTWHANETKSLTGISNSTTFTKSLIDGIYQWNCLAYDSVSQNDWADMNWTININIIPNDTSKFYIRNSSNNPVTWFGSGGNIVLKGNCFSGGICDTPGIDSFIIRNSTHNNVAFVNSTGDMCITTGDCSDQSANCNSPLGDSFIVKNNSVNMIYIDSTGDLCLKGKLFENSNP